MNKWISIIQLVLYILREISKWDDSDVESLAKAAEGIDKESA